MVHLSCQHRKAAAYLCSHILVFVFCALTTTTTPRCAAAAAAAVVRAPTGGCTNPAAVAVAVGSGENPEKGYKVLDSNLRSKWTAWGHGASVWLELEAPTVIDAVAIAFKKVSNRLCVSVSVRCYVRAPSNYQASSSYKCERLSAWSTMW